MKALKVIAGLFFALVAVTALAFSTMFCHRAFGVDGLLFFISLFVCIGSIKIANELNPFRNG